MARDGLLYYGLRYYGPSAQRPSTGTCTCCTPYYYLPSLPRTTAAHHYCCAPLLPLPPRRAAQCTYYEYQTLSTTSTRP